MTEEEVKPKLEEKVKELADAKPKVEEQAPSEFDKQLKALREDNERMQNELLKQEELKAKILLGGKGERGQPEPTVEEKAKEEASEILKMFQ